MSLDYELVKQLKDAGFPLKYRALGIFLSCEWIHTFHRFDDESECFEPTFSEIIEACLQLIPDKFLDLKSRNNTTRQWVATSIWIFVSGVSTEESSS